MKINYIILFCFSLNFIFCHSNSYSDMSLEFLPYYSKRIIGIKGKTNKTKCIAKTDIKINETLFKFEKSDVLTSEKCFHPQRHTIYKNISAYTNNTYTLNKMILSFCIYYVLSDPDFAVQISNKQKMLMLNLPIDNVEFSEKLFYYPDLNEFLITGRKYNIEEPDMIEKVIDRTMGIKDRRNPQFKFYSKIYYYISSHSFNINEEAVVFPYIDLCNIVPNYLSRPNKNYTNSTFAELEGNHFFLKSARSFIQNEQYLFSYNIPLDNDLLMLKQGIFVHDNYYDKYTIDKRFSFEHNYESDELLHNLRKHNLDPKILNYHKENAGKSLWLKFDISANKINDIFYRFGIIYFNWWKTHSNDKINSFRHIAKQALTLILRTCYDELVNIEEIMEMKYDDYVIETEKGTHFTPLNKKLREFNIEKIHLIHKNINYVYKELVNLNYNEIQKFKDNYVMVDPNRDS